MLRRSSIGLYLLGAAALLCLAACRGPQGAELAERAFQRHLSGVPMTVPGQVVRSLDDDIKPPRHQRFIIETERGQTLLVLYNLDFGRRVPLHRGDRVIVRGEYVWNSLGGAMHRTHADQSRRTPAGWITLERTGKRYP